MSKRKVGKAFRVPSTIRYAESVGIEVGITKFAHDSDNQEVVNPQFLTTMLKPVSRAHRRLSRSSLAAATTQKQDTC